MKISKGTPSSNHVPDKVVEVDALAERFQFGIVAYTSVEVFWLQCSAESAQISRESNSEPIG